MLRFLVLLLTACGPGFKPVDAGSSEGDADTPMLDAGGEPISWTPCSVITGETDDDAGCTTVSVPLRWSRPDAGQLGLFLKKLPSADPARTQLWLLQGGPGGASDGMESLAQVLMKSDPSLEVYLADHRGTGRSRRLSCPVQESDSSPGGRSVIDSEWDACIAAIKTEWGDGLEDLSSLNAASDLGALIQLTRRADARVFIYGTSYGTYVAHRYLQQFPEGVDGVVLDSIAPPNLLLNEYDERWNFTGRRFLEVCGRDAFCASKLGPDPWQRTTALFAKIDTGHCQALGRPTTIRSILRQMNGQLLNDWASRLLIPAIIFRADRCEQRDVAALARLFNQLNARPQTPPPPPLHSSLLFIHIGLSELWERPAPPLNRLEDIVNGAFMSLDTGLATARLQSRWPAFQPDPTHRQWATTHVPLLMLNGTLDSSTTIEYAREVASHFQGPAQRLIEFPLGTHNVLRSPRRGTDPSDSCGLDLLRTFLKAPRAPIDAQCTTQLPALDFRGSRGLAQWAFGVDDIFD